MEVIEEILSEESYPQEIRNSGFSRIFSEWFSVPSRFKPNRKSYRGAHQLLFVIIFPSHLKQALPILKKLASRKIVFTVFLFEDKFKDELNEFEDKVLYFNNLFSYPVYFSACFSQLNKFLKFRIRDEKLMSFKILKSYKISYLITKGFDYLLSKDKINKIILFKGDGVEAKTIAKYLKQKDTQTKLIVIQHGIIAQSNIHANLLVDEFWVWSNFWKERLLRSNVGCRVEVVGDPQKADLFANKRYSKKIESKSFKILFAPNSGSSFTPASQVLHSCKIISDFVNGNSDVEVVVKPHPGDIHGIVKKFFITNNINVTLLDRTIDVIKEKFYDADLVVINNSGILTEAAIFEIPGIIIAEDLDQLWVKQYFDFGIAEIALTSNQFSNKLDLIRSHYELYKKKSKKMTEIMYEHQNHSLDLICDKLTT